MGYLPQNQRTLKKGIDQWLRAIDQDKGTLYPLTLGFKDGPWLYADSTDDILKVLEVEIGIFLERCVRLGVPKSERTHDKGWAYLGWPDKGGKTGYLHHHGFLIVPVGQTLKKPIDDILSHAVSEGFVIRAHIGEVIKDGERAVCFNRYAGRHNVGDPVWYKTDQRNNGPDWIEEKVRGATLWRGGGFVLVGGKSKGGWKVYRGESRDCLYQCRALSDAKTFCAGELDKPIRVQ